MGVARIPNDDPVRLARILDAKARIVGVRSRVKSWHFLCDETSEYGAKYVWTGMRVAQQSLWQPAANNVLLSELPQNFCEAWLHDAPSSSTIPAAPSNSNFSSLKMQIDRAALGEQVAAKNSRTAAEAARDRCAQLNTLESR